MSDRQPPLSVTCPRCHRVSYHPEDFVYRYCGFCHEFHDDAMPVVVSVGAVTNTIGWVSGQPGYLDRLADLMQAAADTIRRQAAANRTPRPTAQDPPG
jgi:hypothetical protein